jgi:hypothetical protein
MIKERAWPVKAMYILIAAALAISLMIMVAPAQKASAACGDVKAEWDRVSTPSGQDLVLAPDSIIWDYAVAEAGDMAYAVWEGALLKDDVSVYGTWLLKSDDGAATWSDITLNLPPQMMLPRACFSWGESPPTVKAPTS